MSRELDRRDFSVNKATPARQSELDSLAEQVSNALPGQHRISIADMDATKGNPSVVRSQSAPAEPGDYVRRALGHLRDIGAALGLAVNQPPEFIPDPKVQYAEGGGAAVHLQQQHEGIPIFEGTQTVRFGPDGALRETVGSCVTVGREAPTTPTLPVREAVARAAQHVAGPDDDEQGATDQFGEPLDLPSVDLTGFEPRILAAFHEKPEQSTVLSPGPFGDNIKASLILFPLDDDLRLAWEVILTMPGYQGQYRTLVDSQTGDILYCRQLVTSVAARGNVYRLDGEGEREMTDFPRLIDEYGLPNALDLPGGFPDDWVESDSSVGNSVRAHLGEDGPVIQGAEDNQVIVFDPADSRGDDQKVLNIFYYNGVMHDFFYLLGFREADGNFQQSNLGRGGAPSDRVDARAHSGRVYGTANMLTPIDGSSPVMNMGLVGSTGKHTAFDSSVVYHEFTHGVTSRLVGGAMNSRSLEAPQSGGMGEGWGDYIACTINHDDAVGAWVMSRPTGFRRFLYNSDYPDNFGDLGTGRYTQVHNIGEIWCATLLEMNRNIEANLAGMPNLAVQLVVDGLKLSPATPSFLQMRDSILAALDNRRDSGRLSAQDHFEALKGFWTAFAKFGMGPGARSNGATLSGIAADFTMPDIPEPPPEPPAVIPQPEPGGLAGLLRRLWELVLRIFGINR